jgi:hypothetical protein
MRHGQVKGGRRDKHKPGDDRERRLKPKRAHKKPGEDRSRSMTAMMASCIPIADPRVFSSDNQDARRPTRLPGFFDDVFEAFLCL